ncbi:MAG: hypothetical protein NTV51_12290, partial [Verrucomicrobia bacterium]|nr:hypothetical protein [Verrucomicrobiota bacterium]
ELLSSVRTHVRAFQVEPVVRAGAWTEKPCPQGPAYSTLKRARLNCFVSRRKMSATEDLAAQASHAPQKKKRAVWPLNLLSALPLLFVLTLSSHDPLTLLVKVLCLTTAVGASYFSVRLRLNFVGLLVLLFASYCYAVFLFLILTKG